ncbi:MAG: 50S ribosomal protein L19 [Candidatus Babeliales bacterium]
MKAKKYTKETINALGIYERNFPKIEIGDTIAVSQKIKEVGEGKKGAEKTKERIQVFQGDVIAMHQNGVSSTFTVRKIGDNSVSIERIFPFYSPVIESIQFIKKGKVRRAKLYYLRKRIGKAAYVGEKVMTREQRKQKEEASNA